MSFPDIHWRLISALVSGLWLWYVHCLYFLCEYADIVLRIAQNAPGYMTPHTLNPDHWPESWRFPHCIGAALIVYPTSSTCTSTLRSLFDNPVSVCIGKISYALYLVHGPVVHMLGFWLVPWCWSWTGKETMMAKETGFGVAFLIVTAVTM